MIIFSALFRVTQSRTVRRDGPVLQKFAPPLHDRHRHLICKIERNSQNPRGTTSFMLRKCVRYASRCPLILLYSIEGSAPLAGAGAPTEAGLRTFH